MDILLNNSEQAKEELVHFGVLGMHWGRRKSSSSSGQGSVRLPSSSSERRARKLYDQQKRVKTAKLLVVAGFTAYYAGPPAYLLARYALKTAMIKGIARKTARAAARAASKKYLRIGPGTINSVIDSKFL